MSAPLDGRVALVTGVSRRVGIAWSIVERLVADGASIYASGWEPHDAEMEWGADADGGATIVEIAGADGRVVWESADLGDADVPARLVGSTVERFGAIDIVVATHARSSHDGLLEVTVDELDAGWRVNARGSLLLAQALGRTRPADPERAGRMILFTSGQHIGPMGSEIAYAVSKGAIHQMTASVADELADLGITVNCVNPGPVDTGWAVRLDPDVQASITAQFPAGRWGQPSDIAATVGWLVGPDAAWVTGQVLNVEGGFRRWS